MPEYSVIGKRHNRIDAIAKVTGSAVYAADITLPNMLYGKILWSTSPHARIRRLDVTRAQALDGVKAVVTATDTPPQKEKHEYPNPMASCLAREKVIFAGQPIAAVAATSLEIAEEAIALIKVDYEELTPVMDVVDAMKPDAPRVHPHIRTMNLPEKDAKPGNAFWYTRNIRGDIDAGFKEADIVLENTYRTQTTHQAYLEPRASIASFDLEGKVTLWSDNQGIFECREVVAHYLEIPLNKIKVIPVESGGAFGGKSHQVVAPICVLLSKKSGRPVKIVTTRDEVFKTNRPGAASAITIKIGATKKGLITAASMTYVFDFGALHGVDGMGTNPSGTMTGLNPYHIPNFVIETYDVFTNKIPSGPYRSPTGPQSAFAVESQIDLIARALEMDPLEFRIKNAVSDGEPMVNGAPFGRIGFKQTLERMQKYLAQKGSLKGENRGRGIGCGFWGGGSGPASAVLHVNADGTVELVIGSVDVSGVRTTMAQLVAEELDIPFEDISVVTGDTETAPFSVMSVGSMITRTLVPTVINACNDVKRQLCERAAPQLEVEAKDVEYIHGRVRVKNIPEKSLPLIEINLGSNPFRPESSITGRGSSIPGQRSMVFVVQAADVEVDKETGKVKLLSYAVVQDVGFALNPKLIEGQIQGAVAQGIGWAFWEDSIFEKGVMQNANLLDYRIPTAVDVPPIDIMLIEVPHSTSPLGIRGVGEPPLPPTLGTLANAIHSATGVRLKETPMSPEAIFWALKDKDKRGKIEGK
jgi:xanthine dehydrogenase molybdenum-binding subunit